MSRIRARFSPAVLLLETKSLMDAGGIPPGISPDAPADPPAPPVQLDLSFMPAWNDSTYFPDGPDAFVPAPWPPETLPPLDPASGLSPFGGDPPPFVGPPAPPPAFNPPIPGATPPAITIPLEPYPNDPQPLGPEPPDFGPDGNPPIILLPPVPIGPESPW